MKRLQYLRRVIPAYLGLGTSQLTFWHDKPELNEHLCPDKLAEYYMPFIAKADYSALLDDQGIPKLHYRGVLGPQYNPIAIAQFGLGNYNQFCRTGDKDRLKRFLRVAEWLIGNLEPNSKGFRVWMHKFDWEYRECLRAPWYSALAQGQGISVLVRAAHLTDEERFMTAATDAMVCFYHQIEEGGVTHTDADADIWFEEYLVNPPTHILNGFMWASWGIYDFFLSTRDLQAKCLFDSAMRTLEKNLHRFDVGYWSLYEISGTRLPMLASPFYHELHIAQLRVLARITQIATFEKYADRWRSYQSKWWNRNCALAGKAAFKLCYY